MTTSTIRSPCRRPQSQGGRDVFPVRAPRTVLALAGARDSLCTDHGLQRLARRHVRIARLEDAPIPVHLVATDLLSGEEVLLPDGDGVSAVLASSSGAGQST